MLILCLDSACGLLVADVAGAEVTAQLTAAVGVLLPLPRYVA